jgi:hypothetical protein
MLSLGYFPFSADSVPNSFRRRLIDRLTRRDGYDEYSHNRRRDPFIAKPSSAKDTPTMVSTFLITLLQLAESMTAQVISPFASQVSGIIVRST